MGLQALPLYTLVTKVIGKNQNISNGPSFIICYTLLSNHLNGLRKRTAKRFRVIGKTPKYLKWFKLYNMLPSNPVNDLSCFGQTNRDMSLHESLFH